MLTVIVLSAAISAIIAVLIMRSGSPARVLRAEVIELVAPNGQVSARVAATAGDGAGLTLLDQEGRPRLTFKVGAQGDPAVKLQDANGQDRIELVVAELPPDAVARGLTVEDFERFTKVDPVELSRFAMVPQPGLFIRDEHGRNRLAIGADGLFLYGDGDDPVAGLAAPRFPGESRPPGLMLTNADQTSYISISVLPGDIPLIHFMDVGETRLTLGLDQTGAGSLKFFNEAGECTRTISDQPEHNALR